MCARELSSSVPSEGSAIAPSPVPSTENGLLVRQTRSPSSLKIAVL